MLSYPAIDSNSAMGTEFGTVVTRGYLLTMRVSPGRVWLPPKPLTSKDMQIEE